MGNVKIKSILTNPVVLYYIELTRTMVTTTEMNEWIAKGVVTGPSWSGRRSWIPVRPRPPDTAPPPYQPATVTDPFSSTQVGDLLEESKVFFLTLHKTKSESVIFYHRILEIYAIFPISRYLRGRIRIWYFYDQILILAID